MNYYQPAIDLIEHFEGCILHAYKDPVGIWTIGYGTTKNVRPGQVITRLEAERLLLEEMDTCINAIHAMCHVPLSQGEACALISLAYNIGIGALEKSGLIKKLNSGAPKVEVANEFLKWVKAGGHVLSGLVNRRKAERSLFLSHHGIIAEELEG